MSLCQFFPLKISLLEFTFNTLVKGFHRSIDCYFGSFGKINRKLNLSKFCPHFLYRWHYYSEQIPQINEFMGKLLQTLEAFLKRYSNYYQSVLNMLDYTDNIFTEFCFMIWPYTRGLLGPGRL